jgi:hypothetical protein
MEWCLLNAHRHEVINKTIKKTQFGMYLNGKDKHNQSIVHLSMIYCAFITMVEEHVSERANTLGETSHQLRAKDFL